MTCFSDRFRYLPLFLQRLALAILVLLMAMPLRADQLEIRLEPENEAAQDNVRAYVGTLDGLDVTGLRRKGRYLRKDAIQALEALGYYASEVEALVEESDPPRLILSIKTGEPVRLSVVDIRVIGPASDMPEFIWPSGRYLKKDAVLSHAAYEDAKRLIQNQALRYGFFAGKFTHQQIKVDPALGTAEIALVYDSGPRYLFGKVSFEGDSPLDEQLLSRYSSIQPGLPYDSDKLAELNQALQSSGYFDQVLVDAPRDQAQDGSIPVIIQLGARKPRTLGLGVGFSTDVGPRARTTWTEHWINSAGHRRGAELEISAPRQNAGLWYEIPLDPPMTDSLRFTSGYQRENIEDTDSQLLTAGSQWQHKLDSGWQQVVSLRWDDERYILAGVSGSSTLLLPGIGYSKTHSDHPIDPTRGYRFQVEVAGAQRTLLSDADILHASALAKGLWTLGNSHRVLVRSQIGLVATNDFSSVPPSLRFFTGGDQSVRGYDYRSLSPQNSEGKQVGGRYLLVGSAEYQIPVAQRWRLAAFIDEGNAIDSPNDALFTGVGMGGRWVSPLGPLRLDLAYGLDKAGGGGWRVHFSMGPEL